MTYYKETHMDNKKLWWIWEVDEKNNKATLIDCSKGTNEFEGLEQHLISKMPVHLNIKEYHNNCENCNHKLRKLSDKEAFLFAL